ncbi:MAG: ABC transporter ATP-binding protein [Deltaproteobacteria bacterium]|nr:ABC transporter ATP-binding protein [Deltaproteobacteria bacterium]
MNNDSSIKIEGLSKSFGDVLAVDGLTLDIKKGELFGLVGPDGAGKTTTLRLLAAILEPSAGEAWVTGYSIKSDGERIKEHIGYMPQRFGLYEDLTVIENINFYADIYEVTKKERAERIEKLLGFSNLTPFKDRLAGKLSGGMKQKLGLACALIHTPKVLLLDEPTNGVDPVSRRDFWRILYGLLKEGITILVSTAYLDEAERSTRVGLIHKGKLLTTEEPDKLKKSLGYPMYELWLDDARSSSEFVSKIEGVVSVSIYGDKLHMAIAKRESLDAIIAKIKSNGAEVKSLREILPSLEDIFITRVNEYERK